MKYFGTDGIRGIIGQSILSPQFVINLGFAVGTVLIEKKNGPIIIGKDTRISGYMLESALEAGLSAAGVDIILTGPLPTPAIACLVSRNDAAGAFVISASHNSYDYNGIKIFNAMGEKLSSEVEQEIEAQLTLLDEKGINCVSSRQLGKAVRQTTAANQYIRYLTSCLHHRINLEGIKIVFDGAHGASYFIGPTLFRQLGAEVVTIGCNPDGLNINKDCGTIHQHAIKEKVDKTNADIGVALDGDGDRVTLYHRNQFYQGDKILYLIAKFYKENNLPLEGIVGTVLSNSGLEASLLQLGISFDRSAVGDKHVYNLLKKRQWDIGGEPSGHLIFRQHANTGDGLLAALKVLELMVSFSSNLDHYMQDYIEYPHQSLDLPVQSRPAVQKRITEQPVIAYLDSCNAEKGTTAIVRLSGTEDILRIYVEAEQSETIDKIMKKTKMLLSL